MHEEIISSSRSSFFALLNAVLPEDSRLRDGSTSGRRSILDNEKENEWLQEYYIIYNSYILDGKEHACPID